MRFRTADVFTNRRYAGNPLGFLPDAAALPEAEFQLIAREFNLSETVFVTGISPDRKRFDVRIFTPVSELPFAGHPTIGCALLLVEEGLVTLDGSGGAEIVLVEGAGDVPVRIRREPDGLWARLGAPALPTPIAIDLARDAAADLLGLPASAVVAEPLAFGVGIGFAFVELAVLDALAAATLDLREPALRRDAAEGYRLLATLDLGRWRATIAATDAPQVYPFVRTADAIRSRMFAPGEGIAEDPATGSAAVSLAALLARDCADGAHAWTIRQGVEMGRPSLIGLFAEVAAGAPTRIEVEGQAVPVSEGVLLARMGEGGG